MSRPDAKDYALSRAALLTEGFKGLLLVNGGVPLRCWPSSHRLPINRPGSPSCRLLASPSWRLVSGLHFSCPSSGITTRTRFKSAKPLVRLKG